MDEFSEDHINLIYSLSRYIYAYVSVCFFVILIARKLQSFQAIHQCRILLSKLDSHFRQSFPDDLFYNMQLWRMAS